jgi:spore coat polysaccharide biosynthesis predicted glycosyltransferase SpsG
VIGAGFKSTNPILKIKRKNILLVKNKTSLYPYFQKADLTITAGGISMFESLASRNITLAMQLYKNQNFAIKKLHRLNLIKIIGINSIINKRKLLSLIKKYQKNKKLENQKYLKDLDGKAAYRIEKIIKKIISSKL